MTNEVDYWSFVTNPALLVMRIDRRRIAETCGERLRPHQPDYHFCLEITDRDISINEARQLLRIAKRVGLWR